ncbi:MAG: hypothetical protein ACK51M_20270 [Burkholderiales bacterium]|jgi:hypothetical protein
MSRHLRRLFVSIRAAVLAGGPFVVLAIALLVLELRRTGGTSKNLEALRKEDGEVSFGFVQGGAVPDDERGVEGLENLGALFHEPVWAFHKRAPRKDRAVRLLEANRIDSARLRCSTCPRPRR